MNLLIYITIIIGLAILQLRAIVLHTHYSKLRALLQGWIRTHLQKNFLSCV